MTTNPLFVSQSLSIGQSPLEGFKYKTNSDLGQALVDNGITSSGSNIEANLWLPFASKKYMLSPDLSDYVLVPVPIMFTDIPNTNGDSVSAPQLLDFNADLGMQAFKTFRGKPTFYEHDNQDITKAKGVILDAFMRPLRRYGNGKYYKLVLLLGYDRTKDPLLVSSILSGENNAFSLGFYYGSYRCSICGNLFGEGGSKQFCTHTKFQQPTRQMPDGRLAYRMCRSIRGFETSVVASPAYIPAIGGKVIDPRRL